MAIFYMQASIVRANGGGAIAHSAYISATCLYSERLQKFFSYPNKEEVAHSEIQIPEHAPDALKDRATLWNSVEMNPHAKGICMRFARQFVIATPIEWSVEETIERVRQFVDEQFCSKGMCADWGLHLKPNNPHVHLLLTVHPVSAKTESEADQIRWLSNEKKIFAKNEQGERIPLIDPVTGEQKIRIHKKNGKEYEEKLWARETISLNDWNKRSFIVDARRAWSEHCNKYLAPENYIDHRSYKERGLDLVPQLHEGPIARHISNRGESSWRVEENKERKELNLFFVKAKQLVQLARNEFERLKEKLKEMMHYDQRGRSYKEGYDHRIAEFSRGISSTIAGTDDGTGTVRDREEQINSAYRRLSEYRARLERITERARTTSSEDYQSSSRESQSEKYVEIKKRKLSNK